MAKLTDDAISAMLKSGIRQSVGYSDSRMSTERLRVMQYYNGELPKPIHAGNSKYVSMDVWDSHESMKAQLLEVFSANTQPIVFAPSGADDVELAREATEVVNYTIFRQNEGFGVFRDVIDDSLLGRAGVAKVWWDKRVEDVPYEMSKTNFGELQAHLAQHPDMEIEKVELAPDADDTDLRSDTNLARVMLTAKKDLSQVRILPLPPEEFFISGRAVSLAEAELVGHRFRKSYSDLLKEGYKKSVLDELRDYDNVILTTEPEVIERFDQTDDTVLDGNVLDSKGEKDKHFMVYECYVELDLEDDGKKYLYQVILVGDTILHKQRYSRKPFLAFVPLPRAHAFWGTSYDNLVIPTQNARTSLTRSIVDHSLITTNPRYTVLRGGLSNPRELMENRIGGIVNITRPDCVLPLAQGALNPFVFQTISMLEDDKESRTGISRLSQGLNKDALSQQNSADMVEQLISMSQVRQKVVARNFAEGFLRPLYLEVYRLLCEHESQQRLIQVAGKWTPVDPTNWPERDDMIVTFTLGYGEEKKKATDLAGLDKLLSSDPRLARMYPEAKRYNVIREALVAAGHKDVDTYLVDPSTLPAPQPTPLEQADLAVKQADAAVKLANAQAAKTKVQLDMQKMQLQHQIEVSRLTAELHERAAKLHLQASGQTVKQQLEQDRLAHQVAVDAVTLQLEEAAQRNGTLKAVASSSAA